jgi:hypothetical protein
MRSVRQPGREGFAGQVDLRARRAAVSSAPKSRLVVRSSLGAKATRDVAVVENGLVVSVGPIDLVQGLIDQECASRSPLGRPATTRRSLGGLAQGTAVADQIDLVGRWRVHLGTSPTGASSPGTTTRIEVGGGVCTSWLSPTAMSPCIEEYGRGVRRSGPSGRRTGTKAQSTPRWPRTPRAKKRIKSEISALTSVPEYHPVLLVLFYRGGVPAVDRARNAHLLATCRAHRARASSRSRVPTGRRS